jgi:organic radical activating enzyme
LKELACYTNGETTVTIFEDGTKIREGEGFSLFPESMDVKITNYCDAGCRWCHEDSTVKGVHGDLESVLSIYKQLPAGVEIAIGGGNPLSHPDFDDFVLELSSFGIVCNVTVNEFHWNNETQKRLETLIAANAIKGVGYSYSKNPLKWDYEHACTHVITGVTNYEELDKITEHNAGKVLLLGYKHFRRGNVFFSKHEKDINENIMSWYKFLFTAAQKAQLSFDNLGIKQLNPSRLFSKQSDYDTFYMGDDGTRTMYLDAVKQEYACNSTSFVRNNYNQDSLITEMFADVKKGKE